MINSEIWDKEPPSGKEDDWCVTAGGEMEAEMRSMERRRVMRRWWSLTAARTSRHRAGITEKSPGRREDEHKLQPWSRGGTRPLMNARTLNDVTIWETGVDAGVLLSCSLLLWTPECQLQGLHPATALEGSWSPNDGSSVSTQEPSLWDHHHL